MEKLITSREAPERFDELLREVSDNGDRYVVERDAVPPFANVPTLILSGLYPLMPCSSGAWSAMLSAVE